MFSAKLTVPAIGDAFRKLHPAALVKNPVLFTTAVVALLLTLLLALGGEPLPLGFQAQLIVWLWLTVLFGTFAEALAEGAAAPRRRRCARPRASWPPGCPMARSCPPRNCGGDEVLVETGDLIPADGEVIAGVASGQRGRHHRRKRARDPRGRRRPVRRHRRHASSRTRSACG
jgi:K+-transporting ATPase ATPase B chain